MHTLTLTVQDDIYSQLMQAIKSLGKIDIIEDKQIATNDGDNLIDFGAYQVTAFKNIDPVSYQRAVVMNGKYLLDTNFYQTSITPPASTRHLNQATSEWLFYYLQFIKKSINYDFLVVFSVSCDLYCAKQIMMT